MMFLTYVAVNYIVYDPCYTHPTYVALHEVMWHGASLYGVHRTRLDGSSFT